MTVVFLTEDKVYARILERSNFRYRDKIALPKWNFVVDKAGERVSFPSENNSNSTLIRIGDR